MIANGQIKEGGSVFDVGQSITYSCNSGHRLRGNKLRRCETGGSWSSVEPSCEQDTSSPFTSFGDCHTAARMHET